MITSKQVKEFLKEKCEAEVVGIAPATPFSEESMIRGVVIRINRKTLSIKTKEGRWNVPPQFLRKVGKGEKGKLEIVK